MFQMTSNDIKWHKWYILEVFVVFVVPTCGDCWFDSLKTNQHKNTRPTTKYPRVPSITQYPIHTGTSASPSTCRNGSRGTSRGPAKKSCNCWWSSSSCCRCSTESENSPKTPSARRIGAFLQSTQIALACHQKKSNDPKMYASWCYHGTRSGPKIEPIQLIPILLAIDGHGFLNDTYIMKQNIVENVHTIKSMSRKIVETNGFITHMHRQNRFLRCGPQAVPACPESMCLSGRIETLGSHRKLEWYHNMKTSPLFAT